MTENESKKKESTKTQSEQPTSATNTNQSELSTHSYTTPMSLDRLHRVEKINLVRLGYLIQAGPDHPLIKSAEERSKRVNPSGFQYEPVYEHIKKVFKQSKHQKDTPIGLLHSEFLQPHGESGRLNAKGNMSLQVTSKYVRHFVSGEYYTDIDIVSCHIVLLEHYCETNGIPRKSLSRMVYKRDKIFAEVLEENPKLEREDLKRAILALLNGGTSAYRQIHKKTDALVDFAEEMQVIIQRIAKLNPDLLREVKSRRQSGGRDYNHEGSVMCIILQDLENKCLEIMEEVAQGFGVEIHEMVPIHDGMQIPKRIEDGGRLDELLRACETSIHTRLGVKVDLVTKAMDSYLEAGEFEWPDDSELHYCRPIKEVSPITSVEPFKKEDDIYDARQYYLDAHFSCHKDMHEDFVTRLSRYVRRVYYPDCFIVNKGCVNSGSRYEESWVLDLEKVVDIKTTYTKRNEKGQDIGNQTTSFMAELNNSLSLSKKFPTYKGVTFNPNLDNADPRMFNMFNGFQAQEVETVNMDYIQPLLDHILTCWCSNSTALYRYVLQWFRQAFAEPWEKTGVVVLLLGDEGTGKGTLLDKFIKPYIYGEANSLTIQGLSKIVQRFNSALMNKLLVCANEVNSGEGFHDTFDTLKALITDPTFCPEKKGLDVLKDYPVPCNFIFTTNNHNSVKLGRTDRRYLCLETSNRYVGDRDYFNRLYSFLASDVVQRNANHFFTYCKRLEKVGELRNIPMTDLKTEMMAHAKTSVEAFLDDVKDVFGNGNTIGYDGENWELEIKNASKGVGCSLEVTASGFYCAYQFWCESNHEKLKGHRDFGHEMKRMIEFKRRKSERVYILPILLEETTDDDF
jgi:hypothetical protein